MKLTVCTDTRLFSKQVETKFEMILEEYNMEKLTLIGMPLEKLPLNRDGLPLILQKIYDYIIDYGLCEECLFDEAYSNNGRQENIISAYELVSGSSQSCRTIIDVDAVDVATVLVMWLYYLPEPLVSPKQFSMICDLKGNKTYEEIVGSMNKVSRQTLRRVINIVDSYEKQHKSYKEKLGNLFTLLLTKHVDIACQNNSLQFMDNLKTVFVEAEMENDDYIMINNNNLSVAKENIDRNENIFNSNNLCNKNSLFRSWSDNELNLKGGATQVNRLKMGDSLKKSSSCNLVKFFSKEDDSYSTSSHTDLSSEKDNLKSKSMDVVSDVPFHDDLDSMVDEFKYTPQIDDMRSIERTMPTHFKSTAKRNKTKSVKSHVDKILTSGFLSNEDSLLLRNTLELMKILSKIKSVQNQINIQRRNWEDGFGYEDGGNMDNNFPELHFLKTRLDHLANQKNNYLSKTGLSYGKSYNRTVLNLKNAQKEAFKLHENEKNNLKSQNYDNVDNLIADIYNIQIVLDYLENNCGGKELPWRSSKGCPGYRRKTTKKQLNCVAIVSDLQTIGEHEVMETVTQPLSKQADNAFLRP